MLCMWNWFGEYKISVRVAQGTVKLPKSIRLKAWINCFITLPVAINFLKGQELQDHKRCWTLFHKLKIWKFSEDCRHDLQDSERKISNWSMLHWLKTRGWERVWIIEKRKLADGRKIWCGTNRWKMIVNCTSYAKVNTSRSVSGGRESSEENYG